MSSIQFRVQDNQLQYKNGSDWKKADSNDDNALSIAELQSIGLSEQQAIAISSKYGGDNHLIGIQDKAGSFDNGEFTLALKDLKGTVSDKILTFDAATIDALGKMGSKAKGDAAKGIFADGAIYQNGSGKLEYTVASGNSFSQIAKAFAGLYTPALNGDEQKKLEAHITKYCKDNKSIVSDSKKRWPDLGAKIDVAEALKGFEKQPAVLSSLAEVKPEKKVDDKKTDETKKDEKKVVKTETKKEGFFQRIVNSGALGIALLATGILGFMGLFNNFVFGRQQSVIAPPFSPPQINSVGGQFGGIPGMPGMNNGSMSNVFNAGGGNFGGLF